LEQKIDGLLTNDRRAIDGMKAKIEKSKKGIEDIAELPDKKSKALKVAEYESYMNTQELFKLQEEIDYIQYCYDKKVRRRF
jgi:hypothetical protein